MRSLSIALLMLLLAGWLCGCAYTTDRVDDLLDVADVGITVSWKPQISLFVDAPFFTIWPIGYGEVDGYMFGLGKGKLCLFSPMYYKCWGAVMYGEETVCYKAGKDTIDALDEKARKEIVESFKTGLAGFEEGGDQITPNYFVSCPHLFHIGFVGVVATPRYWDMLDFPLGFTTLDAGMDDDGGINPGNDRPWMPVQLPFVSTPAIEPKTDLPAAGAWDKAD